MPISPILCQCGSLRHKNKTSSAVKVLRCPRHHITRGAFTTLPKPLPGWGGAKGGSSDPNPVVAYGASITAYLALWVDQPCNIFHKSAPYAVVVYILHILWFIIINSKQLVNYRSTQTAQTSAERQHNRIAKWFLQRKLAMQLWSESLSLFGFLLWMAGLWRPFLPPVSVFNLSL